MFAIRDPSIEAIRDIVSTRTGAKFRFGSNRKTVIVDLFTASAIVQVYDLVTEPNKEKMARMVRTAVGLANVSSFSLRQMRMGL